MALEQFPSVLRGCIRVSAGYDLEPATSFNRTDMEVGAPRQQPRDPGAPVALSCSMEFSREQLDIFEGWYRYKIRDGADWFQMPVATGRGVTLEDVRFTRAARPRMQAGGVWMVQCALELRTMPLMSEAALNALLAG
jgi:hypothetical protein